MTDKPIIHRVTCAECLGIAESTDWAPPHGYDHNMIQFKCPECRDEFYMIIHRPIEAPQLIQAIYN